MTFYVPKTLKKDFDDFLDTEGITDQVVTTEVIHDWFNQGTKKQLERCEWYPDSTKSRYENTDNNMNVRFKHDSDVHKGDIVIHPNGDIFVLDWDVAPSVNNRASRAVRCNLKMTVKRWHEDIVDEDTGLVITPGGWDILFEGLPANAYHYDGRPEYSVINMTPGVTPNVITIMTVQYNDKTKQLRIGDSFEWGPDTIRIIDISYVGVDMIHNDGQGVLKIQGKKEPGGYVEGWQP